MKIAICDDDKNELFRILSVLADYQTQRNIEFSYKPFDNSTELASNLLQEHYDIYLLDVVMPGLNGIELARHYFPDVFSRICGRELYRESFQLPGETRLKRPAG